MRQRGYREGMLRVVNHPHSEDCYSHHGEACALYFERDSFANPVYSPLGTAYLPHSCDEWVIGGPDQIRALIADLQAALGEDK